MWSKRCWMWCVASDGAWPIPVANQTVGWLVLMRPVVVVAFVLAIPFVVARRAKWFAVAIDVGQRWD